MVCLDILRVNRALLSEGLKLFSRISRRILHNLIWLSLVVAKDFLSRQALGFLFGCSKFSILALCIDFALASWPVCFCICLSYALSFACVDIVRHLAAANQIAHV